MVVPIFLYASTEQINNHSDGAVSEWMMSMNNLSSNLLHEITWKNDTTYIWNNRSYSILHLMNGTAEEEINGSPVSCNIYWPENEYMDSHTAFTLYTVSLSSQKSIKVNIQLVIDNRLTIFYFHPKFTLAFAIPLVLILVFYILVIRKLRVRIVLLNSLWYLLISYLFVSTVSTQSCS